MSISDILRPYTEQDAQNAATSSAHFDQIATDASPERIGRGVSSAFRAEHTPPFSRMVAELFGHSDGGQQAGLVNQLLRSVNPGMLSGLAGSALMRLLGSGDNAASVPANQSVTPEQASQLTPEQVQELAAHAEQQDPTVIDRVGQFYGQHPALVKSLGGMALALILGKMAHD